MQRRANKSCSSAVVLQLRERRLPLLIRAPLTKTSGQRDRQRVCLAVEREKMRVIDTACRRVCIISPKRGEAREQVLLSRASDDKGLPSGWIAAGEASEGEKGEEEEDEEEEAAGSKNPVSRSKVAGLRGSKKMKYT